MSGNNRRNLSALLASSLKPKKGEELSHFASDLRGLMDQKGAEKLLFLPYAMKDWDKYFAEEQQKFAKIGIEIVSLHHSANLKAEIERAKGIFVGGGNVFRLLANLYELKLIEPIFEIVSSGGAFSSGASAGTVVACKNIKSSNSTPIVHPPSFEAMNVFPQAILVHYIGPDEEILTSGPKQDEKVGEFYEEESQHLVCLPDDAWILIENGKATIRGAKSQLYKNEKTLLDLEPGTDISDLLHK